MDCNETRRFLDAATDGELDLVRQIELDAHLAGCTDCAHRAENLRARRGAMREALPRFTVPPQLRARIDAALQAEKELVSPESPHARRFARFPALWPTLGVAASLAVALFSGYQWGGASERKMRLLDEVVSAHVRSLQVNHLTDVASTDRHTVKPWFAGKLDFSPPVIDLATAGFPLTGGRLEHFDNHPAAALVFRRHEHVINVFIWPVDTKSAVRAQVDERDGYNTEAWSQGGFNFLAISELAAAELNQFTTLFRANQP